MSSVLALSSVVLPPHEHHHRFASQPHQPHQQQQHHHHHTRPSSASSVSSLVVAAAAAAVTAVGGGASGSGPGKASTATTAAMSSLLNKVGVKALRHGPSIDGLKAFGVGGGGGQSAGAREQQQQQQMTNGHHHDGPSVPSPQQSSFAPSRLQNSSSVETLGPTSSSNRKGPSPSEPVYPQAPMATTTQPASSMPPPSIPHAPSTHSVLPPPPRIGGHPPGSSSSTAVPPPSQQHLHATGNSHFTVDSSLSSPVSSTFSSVTQSTNATSYTGHHLQPPAAPPPPPSQSSRLPDVGTRAYAVLKEIGDGSFGQVWLVDWHSPLSLPPGVAPPAPSNRAEYRGKKLVAVKKMKRVFEGGWEECMNLKELRSLRTIPANPNIIPLFDAFLHPTSRELHFVFEWMEGNLYQLTKMRRGRVLAGGLIASIFRQVLLGLHHIHGCGYFHRDMKPENLLLTTTGVIDYPHGSPFALPTAPPEKDVEVIVKIGDFGLARETASRPPYTEYVSTRWYRAPEILLRSRMYSNPVDMWALGAIMAETVTLRPLFPGTGEIDQVHKICEILGDPKNAYGVDDKGRLRGGGQWTGGVALADAAGFRFPDKRPIDFMRLFDLTNVPIQLVDIIHEMLLYDPAARPTTYQSLTHAYFRDVEPRLRPLKYRAQAPQPPFPPGPITPTSSSDGGQPRQSLAPPAGVGANPISPPQSARMELDGAMSPRSMPSSHAHGLLAQVKPAFGGPRPAEDTDSIMTDSQQSSYSLPVMPPAGPYHSGGVPHPAHSAASSDQYLAPNGGAAPFAPHGAYNPAIYNGAGSAYNLPVNVSSPSESTVSPNPSFKAGMESISPNPSMAASATPSSKSRGRGFGSLFHSSTPSVASSSLKRTPSDRSTYDVPGALPSPTGGSQEILDPKKAKKEAERLAKEQAKAKRERIRLEAQQRAQQRSRAVLMKSHLLVQGGATDLVVNAEFAAPNRQPAPIDKGKGRATGTPSLPQIVEDTSRLRPADASRYRQRRRGEDDADVHSVSSNETGGDDGRRFSMASANTIDSDPGSYRGPRSFHHLQRSPSHNSIGGASASRLSVASSPNLAAAYRLPTAASTTSSLDSQLIANMAGLTAGTGSPAQPSGQQLGSSQVSRTRSPSEPRFSPYPRPTLPGIEAFDFPPGSFPAGTPAGSTHDRHFSISSGAPSLLSSQSVPVSVSQQSHQHHEVPYRHQYQSSNTSSGAPQQHHSQPSSPLADSSSTGPPAGIEDAMDEN